MYTIREAADRAGVTSDLLRAWERRYRIVSPRRTPSGYRLYDPADIARLRAMRSLVDEGWTPSAAAESLRDVPADALPAPAERDPTEERTQVTAAVDVRRFVDAAARLDAAGVQDFLDEVIARGSYETVVAAHVFPALRALGEAWERGDLSVAGEHAASAAVGRWLGAAFEAAGAGSAEARPVLVGLPPGARHDLGALAFATAYRRGGLGVRYLGADLPAADWAAAARTAEPAAAVVAVPTRSDVAAARRVRTAVRRAAPEVPILFGGSAAASFGSAALTGPLAGAADELRSRLE